VIAKPESKSDWCDADAGRNR